MNRKVKLSFLALIILVAALYFFLSLKKAPLLPAIISSTLPPNPQWAIPEPTPDQNRKIHGILSQKFTVLGEGKQAVALESEDKKYVLKLFKMDSLLPAWSDQLCPYFALKQLKKMNALFTGYKNGYQDLREETGLVWIHLAKTDSLHQSITVFDLDKREFHLDADTTEFVIQEKAELVFDRLGRLLREGKMDEMEQAIVSLYTFIQYREAKGYMDRDVGVAYNYGFVGSRPIQVDLGRLYKRRDRKMRPEGRQLEHIRHHVEQWKLQQGGLLLEENVPQAGIDG
jgi:hypothetical protein